MKKKLCFLLSVTMIAVMLLSGSVLADTDPKPTNIAKLNYTKRTVTKGKTFELKAYTTPKGCEDNYLVWSIKNTSIVKFEDADHTGDDMDFVAKKKGTTTITCRIKGTSIKRTCKVIVKEGKARITVDDTHMDVDVGEWDDIDAKLVGGTYKNRKLSYTVHNKKIARVKNGRVYGKKVGTTKITIRAKANKKIKKTVYGRVEHDD